MKTKTKYISLRLDYRFVKEDLLAVVLIAKIAGLNTRHQCSLGYPDSQCGLHHPESSYDNTKLGRESLIAFRKPISCY